jgi:Ca2+/Na+ antiporter
MHTHLFGPTPSTSGLLSQSQQLILFPMCACVDFVSLSSYCYCTITETKTMNRSVCVLAMVVCTMFLFSHILVVEASKAHAAVVVQHVDEQNWLAKRDFERREEFEREAKMVVGESNWVWSFWLLAAMPAFVVAAILCCFYVFLLVSRRRRAQQLSQ